MQGLREFDSAKELLEFYRELRNRRTSSWIVPRPTPPPVPPPPEPKPAQPAPPALVVPPPEPVPEIVGPPTRSVVTLRRIIAAAAAEFLMPRAVAASASRTRNAVTFRQVIVVLARQFTSLSTPQLGRMLGGRDHTTIVHAYRTMQSKIDADPVLASKVKRLRAMFEHDDAANTGRRDHGSPPLEDAEPTSRVLHARRVL